LSIENFDSDVHDQETITVARLRDKPEVRHAGYSPLLGIVKGKGLPTQTISDQEKIVFVTQQCI
jgi:hypothetical protein